MVSAGLLMAISLVSFMVNMILRARAVAVERDHDEDQRARAEQVNAILEELHAEADPSSSLVGKSPPERCWIAARHPSWPA